MKHKKELKNVKVKIRSIRRPRFLDPEEKEQENTSEAGKELKRIDPFSLPEKEDNE